MGEKVMKALINKDVIKRMRHNDYMKEIKNFSYDDICTPGNVVVIVGGECGTHHGIVIPPKIGKRFFNIYNNDSPMILTAHNETSASYWTASWFSTAFPFGLNSLTKIEKVYSTSIDVNKLKDKHDVWEIYKRFRLIFI